MAGKDVSKYWNPASVYDLSAQEQENVRQRAAIREKFRAEFLKKSSDPMRAATYPATLFDPAVQRYLSMRATQQDYFRPTPRSALAGVLVILPFTLFTYYVTKDYITNERKRRNGEVSYRDRLFKFVSGTS